MTLHQVAVDPVQQVPSSLVFHALGHVLESKLVGEPDRRARDRLVVVVLAEVLLLACGPKEATAGNRARTVSADASPR